MLGCMGVFIDERVCVVGGGWDILLVACLKSLWHCVHMQLQPVC